MSLPTIADVQSWPDLPVQDRDGVAVGTCRSVYADDGTAFVPLPGTSVVEGVVRLGHPAEPVAASPRYRTDATLSPEQEQALYTHYGVTPGAAVENPPAPPSSARLLPLLAVPAGLAPARVLAKRRQSRRGPRSR